mgnify:FL=1
MSPKKTPDPSRTSFRKRVFCSRGWTSRQPSGQIIFAGDEDGQDDVEQDTAAAQDAEQDPQGTDQRRVNVEILCDPPADTSEHFARFNSIQSFLHEEHLSFVVAGQEPAGSHRFHLPLL